MQTTAIPYPPPFASLPTVHPEVKAWLRLHSTMQPDCYTEAFPSPAGSLIQGDLRGKLMVKSPIKLQFSCFDRIGDYTDPPFLPGTVSGLSDLGCPIWHSLQLVGRGEAGNIYLEGLRA